jgi:hypothetical protein
LWQRSSSRPQQPPGGTALISGITAGLMAGAAGFLVLPFERIGTPLAHEVWAQT